MNWPKSLKVNLRLNYPLKNHTTFKIGGPVKYFVQPKGAGDLKLLLNLSRGYKIPVLVLGAGSNVLASDKGAKAIVLRLNSPVFKKICFHKNRVEAGSAVTLSRLIWLAQGKGLSGLEFLAGIPGTLGGALMMNAGAWGRCIADLVEYARVMDYNGNIKTLDRNDIKFEYRAAGLEGFIILGACLRLKKKNKGRIKDKIEEYLEERRKTQDLSGPSAGCVFKNPEDASAGALIDKCGLKGARCGDAVISHKHANFILNMGRAKASDVLKLMSLIKKEVKKRFHIVLEPEIKIWQ